MRALADGTREGQEDKVCGCGMQCRFGPKSLRVEVHGSSKYHVSRLAGEFAVMIWLHQDPIIKSLKFPFKTLFSAQLKCSMCPWRIH